MQYSSWFYNFYNLLSFAQQQVEVLSLDVDMLTEAKRLTYKYPCKITSNEWKRSRKSRTRRILQNLR